MPVPAVPQEVAGVQVEAAAVAQEMGAHWGRVGRRWCTCQKERKPQLMEQVAAPGVRRSEGWRSRVGVEERSKEEEEE